MIHVTNGYIPPPNSTGQRISLHTEDIPTPSTALITGDLNGHSEAWDCSMPADERGEEIEQWILEKDLTVLNDGSLTRINKQTGSMSKHNVTLAGRTLANRCRCANN